MGLEENYTAEDFTTKPFSEMWWRDRLREAKRQELALKQAGDKYADKADYYGRVVEFIKRRKGL